MYLKSVRLGQLGAEDLCTSLRNLFGNFVPSKFYNFKNFGNFEV